MSEDKKLFLGFWKIVEIEAWSRNYVDLVAPGFLEFELEDQHLRGGFQFGTVRGWMDARLRDVDGEVFVDWSWDVESDTDPGSGRAWAKLEGDSLVGRIFIHQGDDSAFTATRRHGRNRWCGRLQRQAG